MKRKIYTLRMHCNKVSVCEKFRSYFKNVEQNLYVRNDSKYKQWLFKNN